MNEITECLGCCDHCGNSTIAVELLLEDFADGVIRCTAELAKKLTVVPKVHSQTFRDGECPLSVWNLCKYLFIEAMSE